MQHSGIYFDINIPNSILSNATLLTIELLINMFLEGAEIDNKHLASRSVHKLLTADASTGWVQKGIA